MDEYQTESQQVEAIKNYLKRNGKLFLYALLVLLVIIAATRYWQHHTLVQETQASDLFQEVLVADLNKDADAVAVKAQELISNYSSTPYAQLASLMLAKEAIAKADYKTAEDKLQWIIDKRSSKSVGLHIATERLARVKSQLGEYDAALKILAAKEPEKSYISLYEEAKGDIYMAKGDVANAKIAYLKALQDLPIGAQAPVLQLKLLDLGVGVENG